MDNLNDVHNIGKIGKVNVHRFTHILGQHDRKIFMVENVPGNTFAENAIVFLEISETICFCPKPHVLKTICEKRKVKVIFPLNM